MPVLMSTKSPTLLTLLQKQGIFIDAACGGRGRCGRCRVLIKGVSKPPDDIEKVLIPAPLIKKGYRLACRYQTDKIPQSLKLPVPKIRRYKRRRDLGMAIDIGTTVLKGAVVDLEKGSILKVAKTYNPQQAFGGDVISRVDFANNGNYELLRRSLQRGIDALKINLGHSNPNFTVIVGNPVMISFYLGKSVKNFGQFPFEGEIRKGIYLKNPPGYIFGCIGGFVGGDTLAGLFASGLLDREKPALYIDLGTNGEIALVMEKRIYVISTAAGPAFEGVGLSSGVLAIPGAIDRVVYYKNGFKISTIGNKKPKGFCASGYIDLIAQLLKCGLLSEYGKLTKELEIAGFKITRLDIRKLQLAIGAIHTGVKFLIDYAGITSGEIKNAVITGEFGAHLTLDALKQVGMVPTTLENLQMEKDLPLRGAVKLLLNEITPEETETVREIAVHLELALQKDFQRRFLEGLFLKPWN
ncbi:MAG: ASKHA domain-containing protein [candidate division WOR-3 bacterium]